MLTIKRRGISATDAAANVANVPRAVVPYAASTALTRTVQYAAKTALPQEMRRSFSGPVAYTLNSLRVEPATKDKLSARVLVKNDSGAGVAPENFLFPQVEGGPRKGKRFENALRYAGVLRTGQYAMPAGGATMDKNGNVSGAQIRTILSAMKSIRGGVGAEGQKAGKGRRLKNDLFVGKPNGGNRPEGIWRREGSRTNRESSRLRPLFIFTSQAPQYGQRFDFDGAVQQVARERFRPEFEKAVPQIAARFARGGRA
ncbi:MAG: hypothetical protein J0H69_19570 [Burkholderiales bacterium]|nr:hypothetical protein [Burkholderiales bacterium]